MIRAIQCVEVFYQADHPLFSVELGVHKCGSSVFFGARAHHLIVIMRPLEVGAVAFRLVVPTGPRHPRKGRANMVDVQALRDPVGAEQAYERVKKEMDALDPANLSAMNVDVISATSIALGVAPRLLPYRDRMAALAEFSVRSIDSLVDYAQAAWFVYVTNLPQPEPGDADAMIREVADLRDKLLLWSTPLVAEGKLDAAAVAKIREGSGNKDIPSDVVALVALYRSRWDAVKSICAVTEQDLDRGAELAPQVFILISRRENPDLGRVSDGSSRVRRAWTLLDRAYEQCRRALAYLRHDEGDADDIAPSLRRNVGPRGHTATAASAASAPATAVPSAPVAPAVPAPSGASLGGAASPFVK